MVPRRNWHKRWGENVLPKPIFWKEAAISMSILSQKEKSQHHTDKLAWNSIPILWHSDRKIICVSHKNNRDCTVVIVCFFFLDHGLNTGGNQKPILFGTGKWLVWYMSTTKLLDKWCWLYLWHKFSDVNRAVSRPVIADVRCHVVTALLALTAAVSWMVTEEPLKCGLTCLNSTTVSEGRRMQRR